MANNRMYLKCTKCEPGLDETGDHKDRILIAKYYPSSNWCFFLGSVRPTVIESPDISSNEMLLNMQANAQDLEERENEFDDFFKKHRHLEDEDYDFMWGGKNFVLDFEE